jgi:hypothetical protein
MGTPRFMGNPCRGHICLKIFLKVSPVVWENGDVTDVFHKVAFSFCSLLGKLNAAGRPLYYFFRQRNESCDLKSVLQPVFFSWLLIMVPRLLTHLSFFYSFTYLFILFFFYCELHLCVCVCVCGTGI